MISSKLKMLKNAKKFKGILLHRLNNSMNELLSPKSYSERFVDFGI